MLKHWRPRSHERASLLRSITIAGLLSSLFISTPLWYGAHRLYPEVPIVTGNPLPLTIAGALFVLLILSLSYAFLFSRWHTASLTLALASLIILVAFDYNRLQPWVFHYGVMLGLLVCIRQASPTALLDAARFMIAGIYLWSGLQKLNAQFFVDIFPWFTEPLWTPFGVYGAYAVALAALVTPFFEALIGIGLLTRRGRPWALSGAAVMLVTVLASLGPLGHNWNHVVWPWNIALFLSAAVLFWRWQDSFQTLWQRSVPQISTLFVLLIIWIYPLGSFFGLSEHYLSWSLYSGKVPEARLVGDSELLKTLAPNPVDTNLPFQRWSSYDIGVVPYPETRVHKAVFSRVCTDISSDFDMVITEPLSGRATTYQCADL